MNIALLCSLLISTSALATENQPKDTVLERGTTVGIFKDLSWGDYPHLEIESGGKTLDFFAEKGPWSVFDEHAAKLKGTKLKVSWERVRTFVPEAGMMMVQVRTTDVCTYTRIELTSVVREKVKVCAK